jgi:exopolysaccharide biosynthesis polyprenyl glycosylphosphotransferase
MIPATAGLALPSTDAHDRAHVLRRHSQPRAALLVLADLIATAVALTSAYVIRFSSGLLPVEEGWIPARYLAALPPALLLCIATYAFTGSYRLPRPGDPAAPDLRSSVGAVLAATLLLLSGALLYRDEYQFSRGLLAIFPVVAVPLLFVARAIAIRILGALATRGAGLSRALLVGDGPGADRVEEEIAARPWCAVRVVARIPKPAAIPEAIASHRPDQVFLCFPAEETAQLAEAASLLSREMVDVRVVPDLPDLFVPGVAMLGSLPLVTLQENPFLGHLRVVKRLFDLLVGALLLVVLLPFLALLGLAVLLLSGRPVLYRQERMGLDGRRFAILKFRTMKRDAETETGAVWASPKDPRCTRIGAFLRRFSLDELPQLLNVLRGEMSLVGPRPERPVFIEVFREKFPGYMLRHRIPAGLTGWAQIHGLRGESDLSERLRHDLYYLEHWTLLLDVEILLRTAWHVLAGRNAV